MKLLDLTGCGPESGDGALFATKGFTSAPLHVEWDGTLESATRCVDNFRQHIHKEQRSDVPENNHAEDGDFSGWVWIGRAVPEGYIEPTDANLRALRDPVVVLDNDGKYFFGHYPRKGF